MSLIDLFLDQDAESDRIRRLSRKIATRPKKDKANAALKRTRDDVGFLALALLAAVKLMEEKGVFSEQEFISRIVSLDKIDGLMDGKIDPDQLRQALGLREGVKVTRRVKRKTRPGKPPQARVIQPPREPHAKPVKRSKTAKRRRAVRSKTLAWTEPGSVPAPTPAPVPAAPSAVPAAVSPKVPPPPAPEPFDMSSLELHIPDSSMDPADLGDINFDDYYGGKKKE